MLPHTAYIGVGSNLGDKAENCLQGITALTSGAHSRLTGRSKLYRTEPVDYRDQDWFVNAVIRIETGLRPLELLEMLQSIQRTAGRIQDTVRFGPRILDMDILLFDTAIIQQPTLTVPHPRMHLRRFVLQPLCDIDPLLRHPVLQKTVRYLLEHLPNDENQGVRELS